MAGRFILHIENSIPVTWRETEIGIVLETLPDGKAFKLFEGSEPDDHAQV